MRKVLICAAILIPCWLLNQWAVVHSTDPLSKLSQELERFGVDPAEAQFVGASYGTAILGSKAQARFRLNDQPGKECVIKGVRTLAFFDWVIRSFQIVDQGETPPLD